MSDSVGQQLQQARLQRGLTLEQAAKETHIRERFLQALEADDLVSLPSPVQARGFMRLYAGLLGLNPDALLSGVGSQPPPPQVASAVASHLPTSLEPELDPEVVEAEEPEPEQAVAAQPVEAAESAHYVDHPFKASPHSQAIFDEIGSDLREQREMISLTLAEVEKHTHLRTRYLEALEEGRIQDLPSPVQGRGMLANYARFLNLDADAYLLRFADALQVRREELNTLTTGDKGRRPPAQVVTHPTLRRLLSLDLLVTGSVILLLIVFAIWGATRVLSMRDQKTPTVTAPAVVDVLLATQAGTPAESTTGTEAPVATESGAAIPTAENQSGTPSTTKPASTGQPAGTSVAPITAGSGSVQVMLNARQRAWLLVTIDGQVKFNGRVIPGSAYNFSGNKQIELQTGNAAAIDVFYKNNDMGVLGNIGQVIDAIYTSSGVVLPTASNTPVPSKTAAVTQTVTPGATKTTQTATAGTTKTTPTQTPKP
jgi:cytoskeleton protein RodZ